jgi:hypothetical protein
MTKGNKPEPEQSLTINNESQHGRNIIPQSDTKSPDNKEDKITYEDTTKIEVFDPSAILPQIHHRKTAILNVENME